MTDEEFEALLAEDDKQMPGHGDRDKPWTPAYPGQDPPF